MLGLAMHLSGSIHALLDYAPTNVLLRRLQTRRGLKWSLPAMLVGVAYLWAAATCTAIIDRDGPGWLHIIVLLLIWNALKFIIMGPVSLILLARVRLGERRVRRAAEHEVVGYVPGRQMGPVVWHP